MVGRQQSNLLLLGALDEVTPDNQVRLNVHGIGLNQAKNLVGLLFEREGPYEPKGFVLKHAVALDSVHRHFRAIVGLNECSVFRAKGRSDNVHFVPVAHQTGRQALCKTSRAIYVWRKSIGTNNNFEWCL